MFSPKRVIFSTVVALSVAVISASSAAATGAPGSFIRQEKQLASASAPATAVASTSYSRQDKQLGAPAASAPAPGVPAARAPRFAAPATGFTLTDGLITMGGVILLLALVSGVAVSRTRRRTALTH